MTTTTDDDDAAQAREGAGFWEPWVPKIGDRVRLKFGGECLFHDRIAAGRDWVAWNDADGMPGTVVEDLRLLTEGDYGEAWPGALQAHLDAGHWWAVALDAPSGRLADGSEINANACAASELLPLDPHPPAATAADAEDGR